MLSIFSCVCWQFVCLLWKKKSNSSAHFVIHIAYFDAVNLFFIYLDINPLSDIWFANIFSHSMGCLSVWLMICFAMQKHFGLMLSYLFIFAFVFIFGVNSKRSLPRPMSRSLPSKFLLEVYGFGPYIQVFNAFWVNFCVWYRIVVKFHSFSVFPTPFIRDCSLPIVFSWLLCCKLNDHICVGLFLSSLFCSVALCVCF